MSEHPTDASAARKRGRLIRLLNRFSKNLAIVVAVVTGLSTIAGFAWKLYEDARASYERRRTGQVAQLTTYADFGEVVKRYREIGRETAGFLKENWSVQWNCDSLLQLYGTGAGVYYSADLKRYAEVREFYEDLGILIRYDAIDFDLVYDVIIFPDDFVEKTGTLTDCVCRHWYGRGRPVVGFSANLYELQENYARRRRGEPAVWTREDR